MSDDNSRFYNTRIEELSGKLANTTRESVRRKKALHESNSRIAELEQQLNDAIEAAEHWKGQAEASPGEHTERIQKLETQLKGYQLKEKLGDVKLAKGVSLDDVFKLTNFDPGTADLEKLDAQATLKAWREAKPGLFADEAAASGKVAPDGAKRPSLTVETPASRGAPDKAASRVTYTRDDIKRAGWQQTRPELVEALKSGSAELIE